ncbi:hypothetical protein A2833_02320 [Candidatus Azambacteria bacterium RIFCSPHIGHO2_01_FULL_44_55]|uniref:Transcriptional repressor PaaX-like central Cas2-like domain-containing protein n=1 Tax=Candidatus Azambacteria bacterium RIFCSPLOWO2_02_FULL_44_14 TaxID=1797306 RepID=A0A1F5CAY5_9BACT|nr:MAG: hypothetical protein A3A18_00425 [Candidatus Azambacteria bacterium RIFCSPLOWO2_01_FULL_44_84]OGD33610.1 MAG: hypothetical protein A3C78_00530 [Candidatus Azambacteria bacterium RIFCSPHIGHO2_02_FULL_45_18]OGD40032.1 MAG: hypothetical protein A3I30_00270 [Candidatus Azambacteria bacterium RIFCSPLOWO2_02_FULL_44_14]OGD40914.1 MAG: hypothetical protein A2833_02320 [Candidatus Azambacteria bacterium RIFCSPHIGHO2_01_FULL_44_55]OGD51646.1 MAG: hypothetical protein A2608_01700 [Candidatus Azam
MRIKNSKTRQLLKYLAIGSGVVILSLLSPALPHQLLKSYIRNKKIQRRRFLEDLKRLQRRDLIDYQLLDNERIKIILKKEGREKTLIYDIDEIKLDKNKKWDGRWRLIMFDIPIRKKTARDVFRKKLKELEFYQLQKSVYLTPYDCENEIDFICEFFKVRNHVLLLTISKFEGSEKLKHYFDL